MPFRVKYLISTQSVGAVLTAKWASAAPVQDWARINIYQAATHNRFAEAL